MLTSAIALVFLVISGYFAIPIIKGENASVNLSVSIDPYITFKALPEKISPMSNDYSSHVIIEIKPVGQQTVLYSQLLDTDITGMNSSPEILTGIEVGNYDVYAKGYSHLTKKKSDVFIGAGTNFIDFSNSDTEYLAAGDVNVLDQADPRKKGDDLVNSIDLAIEIENLDQTSNIEKEDVNKDGTVNSVDLGIAIENLDKAGEQ